MPEPTVTSVYPPIGSINGETIISITGTNFTGATGVTIGGAAATAVVVASGTSITCRTPAGTLGLASVRVTNASGTSATNNLFIYMTPAPTDTYVYLKGGRGDGFVPLWTGYALDTQVDEKSEPYRDIFQSTAETNFSGTYGVAGSGKITVPALMTQMNDTLTPVAGYGLEGQVTYLAPHISDEAAGTAPKQFSKSVTWRGYTSSNGLVYHFRLADILGVGSQPRSE